MNVNSSGMLSCQNVKLMLLSLPVKIDYKDVICKAVCNIDTRNCMLHVCENCPGKQGIQNYLINCFTNNENELDEDISYMHWISTDRTTMNQLTSTIEKYINLLSENVFELCEHHFISKAQSNFLKYKKETVSQNEVIILLDFAENCSFIIQDAVQGFHSENSQATLHPFVVYYRNTNGNREGQSLCVVSDHRKHNQSAVHCFLVVALSFVKSQLLFLQKVIYFSDGAASQYKNYKAFINLCFHEQDHSLKAELHFFATSHGKSLCD